MMTHPSTKSTFDALTPLERLRMAGQVRGPGPTFPTHARRPLAPAVR